MAEHRGAGVEGDRLGAPLHVLLAEDNPVNQRITQLLLHRMGHLVDIVGDGLEAVDAVARTTYDVVLMDVQMPRLDGLEATRTIRSRRSQHQPAIVALTGGDLAEDRAACTAAGMDAFLTKPLTLLALGAALTATAGGSARDLDTGTDHVRPARQPAPEPHSTEAASREALIGRRLDELAGPDPQDEDLDLIIGILRSFVHRSPQLVDALAAAMLHGAVEAVERQAHKLKGSAANLGGAELAALLDRIEGRSRLGQRTAARDLAPIRAELRELRRSLTAVACTLESRATSRPAATAPSRVAPVGATR
jgi:CheY-like chemotaxis protein